MSYVLYVEALEHAVRVLSLEGLLYRNAPHPPCVVDHRPELVVGFPVPTHRLVVRLFQYQEVDHIGHVVVLDGEGASREMRCLWVDEGQLQTN